MAIDFFKEYFQTILFFILFNSALLCLTVVTHELGHLYLGYMNGCKGRIVLLDVERYGTYTEIKCESTSNKEVLALGGFLFTIPLSMLFLFLEGSEKNFFYVVLGLSFSISSLDVNQILHTNILFYPINLIGLTLITYGEITLTRQRVLFYDTEASE
jgi:hypothetical protein